MGNPSTDVPSPSDERQREDNSNDNATGFYKIFLPELMTQTMRIPPAIVKQYKGQIPKNAVIKNVSGHCWPVKLDKIEGNICMIEGWDKFVSDHSLERGDFLVFRYNGIHIFLVKVFGVNGYKKKELLSSDCSDTASPSVPVKETIGLDLNDGDEAGDNDEEGNDYGNEVIFEKIFEYRMAYNLTITGRYVKMYNINIPDQGEPRQWSYLCNVSSGDRHEVLIYRKKDGRIVIGSGWKEFWDKNNIMQGDKCKFKMVLDEQRKIKEILVEILPEY